MSSLRVVRPDDHGGRYRGLRVEVDGREVATLRPNQQVELDLPAGVHTIVGRMDWARSADLQVDLPGNDEAVAVVELSLPFRAIIDTFIRPKMAVRSRRLR